MKWYSAKNGVPLNLMGRELLIFIEGDYGIGRVVEGDAPTFQPSWQILFPPTYRKGTEPDFWAKLPNPPESQS